MRDWKALQDWSARCAGLPLTPDALARLRAYVDLLLQWNRKVALVSQGDLPTLLGRHVADSLVAAAHVGEARTIADLGSGAGFPGLVIAIVRPAARVAVVESRGRKVTFLEEACRCAAIGNAEVVQARIEALATDPRHRHHYDLLTSRALADLDRLLSLARPLAAPRAKLLAMRAAGAATPATATAIAYELPDGTPRQLAIVDL